MGFTDAFDEEEVVLLLAGGEEEVRRGLTLIDQHLHQRLCSWLHKRFPGLSPEDLADAWGATLLCVLQAARGQRGCPGRQLVWWLCGIARARAIDQLRRKTAWDAARTTLGRMRRPAGADRQEGLPNQVLKNEVLYLIGDVVRTLPAQQRRVLVVFIENYPETRSMEVLRREVSKVTGREETRAAVKRALQEGRHKVRTFLRGKGYAFGSRPDK
jgi:DNA-directed RNA polymerase specialized sigma24 family protein